MRRRYFCIILAICGLFAVAGYLATDVDTALTSADRAAVTSLDLDVACADIGGFADEVDCVRTVQHQLLDFSSDLTCTEIGPDVAREPAGFLERGYGCCFDRSRFIEKALSHYGLEVRHVSIHELEWPFPVGYLQPGIPSHALSEVRTERGWMLVDSLDPFIGLDIEGNVYTTPEIKSLIASSEDASAKLDQAVPNNFKLDYTTTYGLYSRHGKFYPPYLPLPDIEWSQFLDNVVPR